MLLSLLLLKQCFLPLNSIHKNEIKIQLRKVLWGRIWWVLQSIDVSAECHCHNKTEGKLCGVEEPAPLTRLLSDRHLCFCHAKLRSNSPFPNSRPLPVIISSYLLPSSLFQIKQVQMWKLSLDGTLTEWFWVGQDRSLGCCHMQEGKQRSILLLRVYKDSKFILASGGPAFSAPSPS